MDVDIWKFIFYDFGIYCFAMLGIMIILDDEEDDFDLDDEDVRLVRV